jgi:hypothetical protein
MIVQNTLIAVLILVVVLLTTDRPSLTYLLLRKLLKLAAQDSNIYSRLEELFLP